jgi:hypothetical protein
MGASTGSSSDGFAARFLGSGSAGILELLLFHPVDTIAKRLMNNRTTDRNWNKILFKVNPSQNLTFLGSC